MICLCEGALSVFEQLAILGIFEQQYAEDGESLLYIVRFEVSIRLKLELLGIAKYISFQGI